MTTQAFDEVARDYDRIFTETPVGRELRSIVWNYLGRAFQPGAKVLELNCGTGEDAVWLADRGVRVVATDSSQGMLALAAEKAASRGLSSMIEILPLDLARPEPWDAGFEFDGAFSNFGGLNCLPDLKAVAELLTRSIRQGGRLILVLMGRWCAWEIAWHLTCLRPAVAFRRLASGGAQARIGTEEIRVWYPTSRAVRRGFSPGFRLVRQVGLGVFLPPPYLQSGGGRAFKGIGWLSRLERTLGRARPFCSLGDHTLYEFERVRPGPRATA